MRFVCASRASLTVVCGGTHVMAGQTPINIDGAILEGGGQSLRVSTSLSCIVGKSIRVFNIRAGRTTPGLRPQHLSGLIAVRDLCGGSLLGGDVGSLEITFQPGPVRGGQLIADTHTAGSVCLLLQVTLPCALFSASPSCLTLRGGTNADMAPQLDYTLQVFKPIAEKFGVKFDCIVKRRGYYPKGGGEVVVKVSPIGAIKPIMLTERGDVTKVFGRAFVAGSLPFKVAQVMAGAATQRLRAEFPGVPLEVKPIQEPQGAAFGTGNGLIVKTRKVVAPAQRGEQCSIRLWIKALYVVWRSVLWLRRAQGAYLPVRHWVKRGVPADKVGVQASEMLIHNLHHGGCVDDYLQDQLIIFMALAQGVSRVLTGPITLHTQTAIHFAEQLTQVKFSVTKAKGCHDSQETFIIECKGAGITNQQI